MKWSRLAINLPTLIGVAMQTVESIRSAKGGPAKEAAVITGIRTGIGVAELTTGRDIVNDAAFTDLLSAYITARVALQNFVTKHPPKTPEGVVLPE